MGMSTESPTIRRGERGSAMIIAILVMVILTLLGISFLLLAETENKIAENERLSAQALFAAESGARMVKRWFDRPEADYPNVNVLNPPLAAVDRTLREIDDDGDPATAAVAQDGSAAHPRYKQSTDRIFQRPYRPTLEDTLLGTEDGPDMRISTDTAAGKTFLALLSQKLFPNYPGTGGLQAHITRVDIYAPPYIELGSGWTRYGMATVKIVAGIYKVQGTVRTMLSERMIKAVLNETPFPGAYGPLQSCDNMSFNGDLTVHWGAATAINASDLTNNDKKILGSWPRVPPAGPRQDMLWGYDAVNGTAPFQAYKTAVEGMEIQDPWFRYIGGGPIADCPATVPPDYQPYPFVWSWNPPGPIGAGTQPFHDAVTGTRSNIYQNFPLVSCPDFDYETWKGIATSGTSDVHYFTWVSGDTFKENGTGTAKTFRQWTDYAPASGQREGLFFFDTTDGLAPHDDDSDGNYDNLTPAIRLQGGTWGSRGFIFLNTVEFQSKGVNGRTITMKAPGEPWLDINQNGIFDAGEPWVNLQYPTTYNGTFYSKANDDMLDDGTHPGTAVAVRNGQGPAFNAPANLWGILYNSGKVASTGQAIYYGSVISKSGIGEDSPAAGTPDFWWDEEIVKNWPPATWDLPRVIITRWETDL